MLVAELTKTKLLAIMALFMVVTSNITFFKYADDIYPLSGNAGFLISLFIAVVAILILLMSLFHILLPVRVVGSLFLLISAMVGYFTDQFGTVIDVMMIQNIMETNLSEANDVISTGLVLRIGLLGVLPIVVVCWAPMKRSTWIRELRSTILIAVAALGVIVVCFFVHSAHYISAIRTHKQLRYYSTPAYPIYSVGKYIHDSFRIDEPKFKVLAKYANTPENDHHKKLVIVVVGETVRADHFSLNGYARETNPMLSQQDRIISFGNISSCGTLTAVSVPCMFSFLNQEDIDISTAKYTENILDVLAKANVNVLWRDNNSSSKGVADRVDYEDFRSPKLNPVCDIECRDIGMLSGLQAYIDRKKGDILIVLHQMGNHGPAYFKRYPPEFEVFKPACHTKELSKCSKEMIVNAYDNALRYTDYFLSSIVDLLKANSLQFEATMLYVGDHGESLGENGLYLHGMPYLFAPKAQTHVPMIAWISPSSNIDYQRTLARSDVPNSHDAFTRVLLKLFEIETDIYAQLKSPPYPLFYLKESDPNDKPK